METVKTYSPAKKKKTRFLQTFRQNFPFAMGSLPFVWQVIFFYVPLVYLLLSSVMQFSDGKFVKISFSQFSSICNANYLTIIQNSICLALTTTFLTFCLAFPLSYFMAFRFTRYKNIFLFLLIIPFWTNCILHIYAWFFVLEKHGFLNTFLLSAGFIEEPLNLLNSHLATLLMMVYFYLPFMVLPLFSSLEKCNPSLLEASKDLGANGFQTFIRILIPLIKRGIYTGIFLVYIPAFSEFLIPEMMGGNRDFFVGNVISLYVLEDQTSYVGIAFTVLSIGVLTCSMLMLYYILKKSINWCVKRSTCI